MSRPDVSGGGLARPPLWLYGCLFLLGNLWGFTFSLMKIALEDGGDPVGTAIWQQAIGATLLFGLILLRREALPIGWASIRYYLITGLVGVGGPSVVLYTTARHVPAGVMSMLITTAPIMTYALALAIRMETPSPRRLGGVVLGFVGVLLILAPEASLPDPEGAFWALVMLIAPVGYAVNSILTARLRPAVGSNPALACGMLLGSLFWQGLYTIPFAEPFPLWEPWTRAHTAVVALGCISALAFILFFLLIQRGGPVFFSQVGYIVTITGVLYGMLLFGERHSGLLWLSLVLLIAAVALVRPHHRGVTASDREPSDKAGDRDSAAP